MAELVPWMAALLVHWILQVWRLSITLAYCLHQVPRPRPTAHKVGRWNVRPGMRSSLHKLPPRSVSSLFWLMQRLICVRFPFYGRQLLPWTCSWLRPTLGYPTQHVHGGDGHVGVVHDVPLGVELEPVVLKGGGLVHVVLREVLDDLEPPGVLWVSWMIGVACFSM